MNARLFTSVAMAIAAFSGLSTAKAQTNGRPAATTSAPRSAPEHLSWYGDPGAPDISGVWVRADDQGKPIARDPDGWRPWPPPLKGKFAEVWKQRVAEAAAGKRSDDPIVGCIPPGMPRFITGDKSPLLIIQSHQRVSFFRAGEGARRVWADGRSLPAPDATEPFLKGTAVGHYEGQDFVVESRGFKDEPIDSTGVPHSDALQITERYHRVDDQTLKVDLLLTDAKALSQAMTTTVTYKAVRDPAWTPQEFICTPKTDYHPERYVH